ncbi:MAG: PEP-CTERM sorting domain-containing protein [Planctomycetota bacterium]|nr:PEP-CTERM sorting domain-containing protein [Planctomycetota bacterium]
MRRWSFDIRLSLVLFGAAMLLANPGRAAAEVLYGATTAGQLVQINTFTGAGTLIGNIGFGTIEAIDYLSNGTLVGIANANQLIKIDTNTGAGQLIGTITGFAWVEGLAYSSSDGVLYGSATVGPQADANRLITIDPTTAQPTSIAPSFFGPNFGDVDGLAVSAAGAIVGSHINAPTPSLFSVNPVSGVGTQIGTLSMAVVGLDFASDGTLYGVTIPDIQVGGPSRLVTIDPASGAIQDIGPIGFDTIQAIAFVPEPATSVMFAVGAGSLLLFGSRHRRQNRARPCTGSASMSSAL